MQTRDEREQELKALSQSRNGQTLIMLDFLDVGGEDRGIRPIDMQYSAMIEAILAHEFPENSN